MNMFFWRQVATVQRAIVAGSHQLTPSSDVVHFSTADESTMCGVRRARGIRG